MKELRERHGKIEVLDGDIVRTNISKGLGFSRKDRDFGLTGTLLLGSVPGVLTGSRVAPWLPGKPLKTSLAIMFVFAGFKILIS